MTSEKIGRYILDQSIGQGAMGVVYRAFDPVIERTVAIKTIRLDTIKRPADRADFKSRFFKEARIAGRLHHSGIVVLHDIGEHQDMPFIVMELVEGRSLAQAIDQPTPLTLQEMWRILERLCAALDYAHEHGVIHSDIKPQNVMLTELGDAKILDFGIARLIDNEKSQDSQYQGTPQYSAPEQITDGHTDHRTDLFALGVLAHKMLSGKDIYQGESLKDILFQIVYKSPQVQPPLPHLGIHKGRYGEIITKALERNPDKRYQTGANLAHDLEQIFRNRSLVAPEVRGARPEARKPKGADETTQTLPLQSAGLQTQRDRVQQKIKRLNKLRTAFENAADEENLLACRDLVRRLEREDENVSAEKQRIEAIEAAIESREKAQLEQTVRLKRREFSETLAAGEYHEAASMLTHLRDMRVEVTHETNQLKSKLANQDRERDQKISEERSLFQTALVEENLIKTKAHLDTMRELGADTEPFERAYQSMANRLKSKTHSHLNEIAKIRKRFQDAADRADPIAAQHMIDELNALKVSVDKETRVLAELEMDQHNTLREMEDSFNHALRNKSADQAQQDFTKLRQLLIKSDPERLAKHRDKLDKLVAKQRKKQIKTWQKEFQLALDKGLEDQARRAQLALAELGDDSPGYKKLLARARGADEETPQGTSLPLILMIGVFVAVLTTWLLTR